jgi:hypothetical protein
MTLNKFFREAAVGAGAGAGWIVFEDGFAEIPRLTPISPSNSDPPYNNR